MSSVTQKSETQKDDRLNVRISKKERFLLERAAQLEGKTLSAFMLEAATGAAEAVLRRSQTITVSLETYERFVAALEAEPEVNVRLLEQIQRTQAKLAEFSL